MNKIESHEHIGLTNHYLAHKRLLKETKVKILSHKKTI